MQLTYRNAQYQYHNIGQATTPTGETGMYRGAKVQFRAPAQAPLYSGFQVLTYRNAQYRSPRYHLPAQAAVTANANHLQKVGQPPILATS